MKACYDSRNLGSRVRQAYADRTERPVRRIGGVPSIGVSWLVTGLGSAVRRNVGGLSQRR